MTIDDDMISAVLADHRERRACPEHDRCTVQSVRAGCLCATTVAVIEHLRTALATARREGAEAMRERAAEAVREYIQETHPAPRLACELMDRIRALPLEESQ